MKHVWIWGIASALGAAGASVMYVWGAFELHYLKLLGLSLPFVIIGGSFGYGKTVLFRIAAIISVFAYCLWIYAYVTTPNESMGDLGLIAAYMIVVGFLAAFFIVMWFGYFAARFFRKHCS